MDPQKNLGDSVRSQLGVASGSSVSPQPLDQNATVQPMPNVPVGSGMQAAIGGSAAAAPAMPDSAISATPMPPASPAGATSYVPTSTAPVGAVSPSAPAPSAPMTPMNDSSSMSSLGGLQKFLDKKFLIPALLVVILIVGGVVWWMRSPQDSSLAQQQLDQASKSNAKVASKAPQLVEQEEQELRKQPSLIFANGVPVLSSQRLQIVLKRGDDEIMRRGGFGALMAVEMLVDSGTYILEFSDSSDNSVLLNTVVDFEQGFSLVLLRQNDGTPQGKFVIQKISHADLSTARLYNLSDSEVNLLGGSLVDYDKIRAVQPNSSVDLEFFTPKMVSFILSSEMSALENRIVAIPNEGLKKMLFFTFGNKESGQFSSIEMILPESAQPRAPLAVPSSDTVSIKEWCEGSWTCKLTDESCESCGKLCLPTPSVCAEGSNGGSGELWNGKKDLVPKKL